MFLVRRIRRPCEADVHTWHGPQTSATSNAIGMGKSTRGVELAAVSDIVEDQLASWMKQAATMPFAGGTKKR